MHKIKRLLFIYFLLFEFWFCVSKVLCQQDDVKVITRNAAIAIRMGHYSDAKELISKALKLDPNYAEAHFQAALLLKALNKHQEMKNRLKIAISLDPENQTYKDEYIKILKEELKKAKQTNNTSDIDSISKEILSLNPEELSIVLEKIKLQVSKGNTEEAKKLALDALDKNKKSLLNYNSSEIGEIYYILAKIEFDTENILKAREYADKATRYPIDNPDKAKKLLAEIKKVQRNKVEGHLKLGKAALERSDFDTAKSEFEAGLAIDPNNEAINTEMEKLNNIIEAKNLYSQAMQKINSGKWLDARDLLEKANELDPNNQEIKKHLAKAISIEEELLKKIGKTDRLPRTSLERQRLVEYYFNEGLRYHEVKNYKDALIFYNRALAIIPFDEQLEKYKSQIEEKIAEIDQIDNTNKTWEKAKEHYSNGEYEEALKLFEKLPQNYSVDLPSYLAFCYWKMGNKLKAKELANYQLVKQPENNRAKFVLANICFENNEIPIAYKLLKEIKESDPEYPGIDDLLTKTASLKWAPIVIPLLIVLVLVWITYIFYKNLPEYRKNASIKDAQRLLNKGLYKECIEILNNIKRLPNLNQYDIMIVSRILAQAYLKTAAYDKAIGECKYLLSINPNDQEAFKWLGFAYLGRRMATPESLPALLNLYKTEQNNVALVQLLGQHYVAQKVLPPEGVQVLEKWLELEPNNPDVLKHLGKLYLQKGRSDDKAMKVFKAMLDTQKAEPEFCLGVAKLYIRLQQYDECLKLCEQVLSQDINNELVHSVLRECYYKMNKLPELIEVYKAYLSENPYNISFQKGLTEAEKLLKQVSSNQNMPANIQQEENILSQQSSEYIVCVHCQAQNIVTDFYCQNCGKPLSNS